MDHVDGKVWFAFLGAPLAWSLQLIIGYAILAHACYPNMEPLNFVAASGARTTAAFVIIATLVIALAALGMARQLIAATAGADTVPHYLARAGVLTGTVFSLLIAFNLLALILQPTCRFA